MGTFTACSIGFSPLSSKSRSTNQTATLFLELTPDKVYVPDGLELDKKGDIILALPNIIDYEKIGEANIYRIDENKKVHD